MKIFWRCVWGFLLVANLTYWVAARQEAIRLETARLESENQKMKAVLFYAERYNAKLLLRLRPQEYRRNK